jgi:hypothetical protein
MGRLLAVALGGYLLAVTAYRTGKERGYVEWRYVNL